MIYQIHGFNILCDQYIEQLNDYIFDEYNKDFPVISTKITSELKVNIQDGLEIFNELGRFVHSKYKNYYEFNDGTSILFSPKEIIFCGEKFDTNRLLEEISRPNIVILSRFHKRAVLHGSAFLYKGKAYLLCAYPGAGKSTLSSAITKYQSDVRFLTDDIICVKKDGASIYNGIPHVSLNKDSFQYLFNKPDHELSPPLCNSNKNSKTTCDLTTVTKAKNVQNIIEIGGVFFLDTPLEDELIKITKLNKYEFFCESIKNIKSRKSLISEFLVQEMQILNNMVNNKIFGVKLCIKHDYSKLEEITRRVLDFIDSQLQNEP